MRVWIETTQTRIYKVSRKSPSTWGCGLKHNETSCDEQIYLCHPLREGVDWNLKNPCFTGKDYRHPLREGVDWNHVKQYKNSPQKGHPLREGVDWNLVYLKQSEPFLVTLYVRVWIET